MIVADLHLHSVHSDGMLTPAELLQRAACRGLRWVALTDHDTVEGCQEALRVGRLLDIVVIPALEVTCYELGQELHVLGYGVDVEDPRLWEHSQRARERRLRRLERMVGRCRRLGLSVALEDVAECAAGQMLGRPHLAAALVQRGYCTSLQEAFTRYLEPGKQVYEPPEEFPVVRALGLIHATGGLAVLAHPRRTFQSPRSLLNLLRRGFDGIEVVHPSQGAGLQSYYGVLARCHRLLATGGSDFHGTRPYDEMNFGKVGLTAEQINVLA
ncbi:MAG: PHP domain-containing protein, partial [Candidatus Kapabacteria bacterium]|nr:PHP domain-containing protein [Candidatus Kapabacteria bacterium]